MLTNSVLRPQAPHLLERMPKPAAKGGAFIFGQLDSFLRGEVEGEGGEGEGGGGGVHGADFGKVAVAGAAAVPYSVFFKCMSRNRSLAPLWGTVATTNFLALTVAHKGRGLQVYSSN